MTFRRRSFFGLFPLASGFPLAAAAEPASDTLGHTLVTEIEKIPVIDSHEHIIPESQRVSQPADFFTLASHYAINDVISAGLSSESRKLVMDQNAPLRQRWATFAPYWRNARFTGYGQALRIAIRDLYGFDEISATTLPKINDAIAAWNKPGLYDRVLRDRAGIVYAVLDDYWNAAPVKPETDLLVPARKFDRFVIPQTPKDVHALEKLTGVSITSLAGLKRAMEKSFEQSIAIGMVTVKSTMAYNRELLFEEVDAPAAERDFERMMKGKETLPKGFREYRVRPFRKMEDHMYHHIIRLAEANGYPVQIHTGLLSGNGGFIKNTEPTGLTNLFFLYPKVKFDLFHISYPYQRELGVLAKNFPNVHLDFCWAHIISPTVSRQALHEYLDTVPVNKIFGFGGDYRYPELSYAHLVMARRNIARVLAEKITDGIFDEEEALRIARLLLHDNVKRLFPPRRNTGPATLQLPSD